jgi:hypothetical protein
MIYFFRRAGDTRSCETRLQADGPGYELVVTDGSDSHVEQFEDVASLVAREYELRQVWRMFGWRTLDPLDDGDEAE